MAAIRETTYARQRLIGLLGKAESVLGYLKGGQGSGFRGHAGRPGEIGGSATTRVGITSQQSDAPRTSQQIARDMAVFTDELKKIKGVKNVNVVLGEGAWEGGGEETWIVQYDGNGKALALLARTGAEYKQQAVLVYSQHKIRNSVKSMYVDYSFSIMNSAQRVKMGNVLAAHGLGGWTWLESGGKTTLRLVAVPQWGMPAAKLTEITSALDRVFGGSHPGHGKETTSAWVSLMTKEGENSYDSYVH